jgi:hypothetical protein
MSSKRPGDFPPAVVAKLKELVNGVCSNPGCGVSTIAPRTNNDAELASVGTAAHIHAASEGGPRYDPLQTRESRRSLDNGIWLCRSCGTKIDSDSSAYPPELLRKWKTDALDRARARFGKRVATFDDVENAAQVAASIKVNDLARTLLSIESVATRFGLRTIDLRPPPPVETLILRATTVDVLREALTSARWLALHGEAGIGKTHLASLIARGRGDVAWIRLRGVDAAEAAVRIDSALYLLSSREIPPTVVLDDVPYATEELALAQRRLADAVVATTLILSTSHQPMSTAVLERMHAGALIERSCPYLTDEETGELLRSHGAMALSDTQVRFLNALGHRHPTLLTAVARYLRRQEWRIDDDTIRELFEQKHLSDANDRTTRAIKESVTDADTRRLLYRLRLVRGTFAEEWAYKLASVQPEISLVHERLQELNGLWLQRSTEARISVSPLVRSLPVTVVPEEGTRRASYETLAQLSLEGEVSPTEIVDATDYFIQAAQYDRAASALSFGLTSFAFEPRRVSPGDLLHIWWSSPLPPELSDDFAIMVRCAQVAAGVRHGADILYVAADVAARLNGQATWGLSFGANAAFPFLFAQQPSAATDMILEAGRRRTSSPETSPFDDLVVQPERLLCLVVQDVVSRDHIAQWLRLLASLPMKAPEDKGDPPSVREACALIVDRTWLRELEKPANERDWDTVLSDLSLVQSRAAEMNFAYLIASSVRARMMVLAEHVGRYEEALSLAEEFRRLEGDPEASFLILECLGRERFYAGDVAGGLQAIDDALDVLGKDDSGGLAVLLTLNTAAQAASRTDVHRAVFYAERATRVSALCQPAASLEHSRVLGELAVALVKAGDLASSFVRLAAGVEILLGLPREGRKWRGVAAIYGHLAGYAYGMAKDGRPPSVGGVPYALFQGTFYHHAEEVAERLESHSISILCVVLAMLADVLGLQADRIRWAERTLEEADADPSGSAAEFVGLVLPLFGNAAVTRQSCTRLADAIVATAGGSRKVAAQRNEFVMTMALLPASASVLDAAATGGGPAACLAIADMCADVGSRLDDPTPWDRASSAFAMASGTGSEQGDLINLANEFVRSGVASLSMVAAVLAALDDRRALDRVVQGHLTAAISLVQMTGNMSMVGNIVLAAIERYWRATIGRAGFRFSHPTLLRAELQTIQDPSSPVRTCLVLAAAARDLKIPIPPELAQVVG